MINENTTHVIKDPVHGTMQFGSLENSWVKPFIDSPNFQRLRHIKQLGMGDYIFPGAVHTRFNHSLGCSYIASQIANKIGLAEEERQLVVIACLLHDIGHGPFSHAFEDIFHHKLIKHEDWTPFFLADYRNSEFFSKYNKANPRHHLTENKFLRIEEMIMHKSRAKAVLADIVSSQLDADRLDYLLRDSHFCGVTYGQFDLRWMLNCMAIVSSKKGERLGITHKGIGVIEHYLMARRLMMRNIYHSQKKLALEYYMIRFLRSLSEGLEDYSLFIDVKKTRLGRFLIKANSLNQKSSSTKNPSSHKKLFLDENFSEYKELCDYDVYSAIRNLSQMNDEHPAVRLAKSIQYRQMPKIVRLDFNDTMEIEAQVKDFKKTNQKKYQDWQITFLQTPHRSYSGEEDPILVVNEHNAVKPINEISLMINAISDKYEHTAFLCIDKEIANDSSVIKFTEKLSQSVGVEQF